jgi:hypothetical protein
VRGGRGDSRSQHICRVSPCPEGCHLSQRGTKRGEIRLLAGTCLHVCARVWRAGLVYGLSGQQPFLVHPPMGGQVVGVDGQPPPPPTDAELALTPGIQGSAANVGMVGHGVVTGMVGGGMVGASMGGGLASCPLAAKLHKADGIKRCVSHVISSLFSLLPLPGLGRFSCTLGPPTPPSDIHHLIPSALCTCAGNW